LISPIQGESVGAVIARVVVAATADNIVNIVLISAAIALSTNQPYLNLMKTHVRATIVPFAFMASAALMLVVLWERSPVLSVALVGPLLAIALYQRSTSQRAPRDEARAHGSPHRPRQPPPLPRALQRELLNAEEQARPLTLCLVDIDDFKRINDRFGHPSGDRVLSQIATRLRQGGEAFRLGGDEFALLLADHDESTALSAAESIVERISTVDFDHIGQVTVSAGSRRSRCRVTVETS
jgi:diguanylate cyclase (GGDEF) domain